MKIISEAEFESETEKGLTVVDFFATWCAPCRMMGGILEEVQSDFPNVNFIKIDVDDDEELARSFGVMSIPTLVIMKDGKEIDKHIGLMPKEKLIAWIKSFE